MDSVDLKCPSCDQKYSDDRTPRNLECGHSLCRNCAIQILNSQKACPECRDKQTADKVDDLPVNYSLLRLVRNVAYGDIDLSRIKVPKRPVFRTTPSELQQDSWKCIAHDKPISFLCRSCSCWICCDCTVVDHRFYPRGGCCVMELEDAMVLLKDEMPGFAKIILEELERKKTSLVSGMTAGDFYLKNCRSDQKVHCRQLQFIKNQLKKLSDPNISIVDRMAEHVRQLMEAVITIKSLEEMNSIVNDLVDCKKRLNETISKEEEMYRPVLKSIQGHLLMDIKILVEEKDPVYAVIDDDRGSRWADIKIIDGCLLLYSLREGKPPEEGITIPFDYVKTLFPKQKYRRSVFFEVGTEEELAGRVYARFGDHFPLIEQTEMMCTGEKGASYRNTCFYKYDDQKKVLSTGDYENNDGSGGRPILQNLLGVPDKGLIYSRPGTIVAERVSTRLHFHLHFSYSQYIPNAIGIVKDGIEILQALSNSDDVSKSKIKDCGMVIDRECR